MADEVKLRNYQIELFQEIQKKNSILFLPAGSGKTFIAVCLIKHMSSSLKKPISEGGKRTYFLANNVELVCQQCKVIKKYGNLSVIPLFGDAGVDYFKQEEWSYVEEHFQVFVMTPQVYLNAVDHGYVSLKNANLLIFDECHHAVGKHPMAQIMERVRGVTSEDAPKILGLSATLLNANINSNDLPKILSKLEETFSAKILTSKYSRDILMTYSAKPNEEVKFFEMFKIPPSFLDELNSLKNETIFILKLMRFKDNINLPESNDLLLHVPGTNRCKLLTNVFQDIIVHIEQFGFYMGYICCQAYLVQLYRYGFVTDDERYRNMIQYTINITQIIRKLLYLNIIKVAPIDSISAIMKTSSKKIQFLLERLNKTTASDRCLIFVERKMTAKSLFKLLKMYNKFNPNSDIDMKADFIVGSDTNPLRNTREGVFDSRERKKTLKNFRKGVINIIIATNILEEGIDIQDCNIVIMFDDIKTFRSYIQSKGRTRMKGGEYILLIHNENLYKKIQEYRSVERTLNTIIDDKDIDRYNEEDDSDEDIGETYTTPLNAFVNYVSAVSLVHKYCCSLPHDIFTNLLPYWFITKDSINIQKRQCKLQMPLNSAIRKPILGKIADNTKTAKRSAAFIAVKLLHQIGALDDNLEPVRIPKEIENKDYWFPNWDNDTEDDIKDGTRSEVLVSDMRIPIFLQNSRPVPNTECYLHIIRTKTEYPQPDIQRKLFCHGFMLTDYNFGILTRHRLPSICEFPVYSDLGKIRIHIDCNARCIMLNEEQISDIAKFHKYLFLDVLRVVNTFFMYDKMNRNNGYFVVPVKLKKNETEMELMWNVIKKKVDTKISRPLNSEILSLDFSENSLLGRIIIPWYIERKSKQFYLVTNASTNINLNSPFTDEKFRTFDEYFRIKYQLEAKRPLQCMLEVRALTNSLDGIRPRPVATNEKNKRKKKKDIPIYLAPEYCLKINYPAVFWYKSIIVPSVLHRMYYLLMAEDLRQRIVKEVNVGSLEISQNSEDTVEYFCAGEKKTLSSAIKSSLPKKKRIEKKQKVNDNVHEEEMPKNIYHEVEVTAEEIEKYSVYVEKPLYVTQSMKKKSNELTANDPILWLKELKESSNYSIDFVKPPLLVTLKKWKSPCGPEAHEVLQALTLRKAGDVIDIERLETLGDSFLKYMVSVSLFLKCAHMNEGHLSILKGTLIGNKYLFYCGKKLQLTSYINATKFAARSTWHPPGFSVPTVLKDFLEVVNIRSALFRMSIPYHEQFSGRISKDTVDVIRDELHTFVKQVERGQKDEDEVVDFLLGKQHLQHKSVSDVVEALIGLYLKSTGPRGAFDVMKYIGILAKEDYDYLLRTEIPSPVNGESGNFIEVIFPDFEKVEKLIGYQFRDKGFILQAFTHPSYTSNSITDCYQRLEFVGDAVLDFLITCYIYEYCGNLTPGQLTDLRSSLVNNNVFGALAVRLGLHKFLLSHCKSLLEAIEPFVAYQEMKNYEVHGNELLILINENDSKIAEEVDVPKALGDVFESLAGAIYLDSGCSLDTVWRIYYSIMKIEIEKFSQNVPMNPVRALYERCPTAKFHLPVIIEDNEKKILERKTNPLSFKNRIYVTVPVNNKEVLTVCGLGSTLNGAKRAASKLALKEMNYNEFVI